MKNLFRKDKVEQPATAPGDGYVDEIASHRIAGWAHDPARPDDPLSVDIVVNDECVARLRACIFREDLHRLGYGDGRKGFAFDPSDYLRPGENRVRVAVSGTGQTLPNGERDVLHVTGAAGGQAPEDLLELSQVRWKGDEDARGLTWGSMMTGDSFVDVVTRHHAFTGAETIVEIGPGYGRLLRTILERRLPFARYLGLELSAARVERLTQELGSSQIAFANGDVMRDALTVRPDVVLCSSTFEHLFPSMTKALLNLRAAAAPDCTLFVDFIQNQGDDALDISRAYFERTTAYIRMYARAELERLFTEAGFRVRAIESIVLGRDAAGADVRRALVVAVPR